MTNRVLVFAALFLTTMSLDAAQMPTGEEYTNSIRMKLVRIEPGSFTMGVGKTPLPHGLTNMRGTQFEGDFDEKPNHKVTITNPFYMGTCEVTNFQYELFKEDHKELRGKNAGLSKEDDEAIINVNWYEARAFCQWLGDKEGMPYRLPTEAEWEYACRAGTTTHYNVGDAVGEEFRKNAYMLGAAKYVELFVGKTTPNAWGLYDMHGNVEEWCHDWYGPYKAKSQKDPVGYVSGDFKVLRGGSHGTHIYYLRSANRLGTVPEDKHWLIGFRVVIGEMPKTKPLPLPDVPLNQKDVIGRDRSLISKGPDPSKPYFKGPRQYVRIPIEANGPVFAGHNHCPAIVECPNGDLLAIWYTGIGERERNMGVCASRLVWGAEQWQQASPFWDPPDRNDTALSMWYDDDKTIYHFNSMSISSNWNRMAVVMRTSTDSGATWSQPWLINPDHEKTIQLSEAVIGLKGGGIALTLDGGGLWTSWDKGRTWAHSGGSIGGNHPGAVQLDDGTILGLVRAGGINDRMPMSISTDGGKTFTYSQSEFHPIGGGQRLALLKLRSGALFLASFGNLNGLSGVPIMITDENGNQFQATEMFGALSLDGGKTWPYKRVITDGSGRPVDSTDGGALTLSWRSSEHRGYLSVCEGLDGVIHLVSSRRHYAFNQKWMMTPQPAPGQPVNVKHVVETFDGPDRFDLDNWFPYKGHTGEFTGNGTYRIDSIMPYGGPTRVVGAGSFEATFAFDNFSYHDGDRWREFAFGFKDKFCRTWFFQFGKDRLKMLFKDNPGNNESGGGKAIELTEMPGSVKARFTYNAKTGQCRAFYGFNGAEPTTEMPGSIAGMKLAEPFSESNAAYILMSEGTVDLDHFEIKPLSE
ncbi:MAG: SUMF1/EgtB/PvdO family nonheme iron enzyme [Planctomycetota bacterium]